MNGKPLQVHGDGTQSRDWLYVEDTVAAIDNVLHFEDFSMIKNEAINIGSGVDTSVIEIARMILKKFGLPENYIEFVDDRPGQVDCHIAGIKKAANLLNWTPSISLEEGLEKTIEWYLNNELFCKRLEEHAQIEIKLKGGKVALQ
jgi:dTDP-glucose 4,6-dehydratase